jgi:uncharacterized caspase-like protein
MVVRLGCVALALAASLIAGMQPAHAARQALVIGINDYDEVPDLGRAVGDARAMAAKLRELGFEVSELLDSDRRTLNQAISAFTARLDEGDTAFVHFSGHGVEIDGENYLLPADVPKPASGQKNFVKSEAIAMSDLITRIAEGGARTRVFVIDACRDNPFAQEGVRAIGTTRGLARVEAPAGTFIMYSAGYRQLALDRLGEDDEEETSVYTRTLLRHLGEPGRDIADVAQNVRSEVQQLARGVGHDQRPAYYDELSARLVLVDPGAGTPEAASGRTLPSGGDTSGRSDELSDFERAGRVWEAVRETESTAVLEAYIAEFEATVYASLARARLSEMGAAAAKGEGLADALPDDSVPGPVPAEQEVAALTPPADEVEEEAILDPVELARAIQGELDRLGCEPGAPDGVWGRRSEQAVERYNAHAGVRLASTTPSQEMLGALKTVPERVCPLVCGPQFVASDGQCVKKTCPAGERLSTRGECFTPPPATARATPPAGAGRPAAPAPAPSAGAAVQGVQGLSGGTVSDYYCEKRPCSASCIKAGKSKPRCALMFQ